MKNILHLFLLCCLSLTSMAQGKFNMELINRYQDTSLPKLGDQIWNDVVGWKDTVKNREYMIAGTTDSIYFFDITNPSKIVVCGRFWGTNTGCINRDYYPYSHYMYTTSDQCKAPGNLQIFDMQYLPDSVVKVYESDTLGTLTHTITIEPETKRLYMNLNKIRNTVTGQTETFAMDILSLENPIVPKRVGRLVYPAPYSATRVHESYARHDTVYCSSENAGLFIWDIKDAANPVLLSAITPPYPQNAYNHSNWLDSTGRYLLFCDETPAGVGMKIYDLKNIREPRIVGNPFKEEGSPHNAYWNGRYAYASMYYGGVQVYDMKDVSNPKIAAYYDTYPTPYVDGYRGCWGVWPFLPSGIILASDMSNGLFLLRMQKPITGMYETTKELLPLLAYPNPFTSKIRFETSQLKSEQAYLEVYDLQGKLAVQKQLLLTEDTQEIELTETLTSGLYFMKVITPTAIYSTKLVKQ